VQSQRYPNVCIYQTHVRRNLLLADVDEIRPQYQDSSVDGRAIFTSSVIRSIGPSVGATIDQIDNLTLSEVGGLSELATPWYSDQILPFDITLAGSNEYGAQAASKIFGVEILNEGSGISIDDAVSEMQATFAFRRRSSNKPGPRLPPPSRSLSSLPKVRLCQKKICGCINRCPLYRRSADEEVGLGREDLNLRPPGPESARTNLCC
jgi:hypothetical protein